MVGNFCVNCFEKVVDMKSICPHCNYNPSLSQNEAYLESGTILLGKYMVGKVLGQGGFGITYLAYDLALDTKIAIKEFFPTALASRNTKDASVRIYTTNDNNQFYEKGLKSFIEEGKVLRRFSALATIVSVYEVFMENHTAYIVMEYLRGVTLKSYIDDKGKLSFENTLKIISPVMQALSKVHSAGIIHRDISPDNIMILNDGGVKLMDFGAARVTLGAESSSLSVILKMGYAPSEQFSSNGNQGPWTDVYSLAATIYHCITGIIPENATELLVDGKSLKLPTELGVSIENNLEKAFMKALNLRASERYQTIESFATAIGINLLKEGTPYINTNDIAIDNNGFAYNKGNAENGSESLFTYNPNKTKKSFFIKYKNIIISSIIAASIAVTSVLVVSYGNRDKTSTIVGKDSYTTNLSIKRTDQESTKATTYTSTAAPTPTLTVTPTEDIKLEYILYFSDKRHITERDLFGLSETEIRIARNEIYARYGYSFGSTDLQDYFSAKSWYIRNASCNKKNPPKFTSLEWDNISFIKNYERAKGWAN